MGGLPPFPFLTGNRSSLTTGSWFLLAGSAGRLPFPAMARIYPAILGPVKIFPFVVASCRLIAYFYLQP